MNSPSAVPPSWSRQRWCGAVALLFLVQIALLFLFSEKVPTPAAAPISGPGIALVLDANVNRQVLETLGASDPTLFALVSPKSFSGNGWLNVPPREHRLEDWTEPNPALPPSPPSVGGMFASFLRTNLSALELGAEKLSPEIRSLARPMLSLPLLTTNLGPPEIARPQVARVRSVPAWSTTDARESLTWLRPQFNSVGGAWSALTATNAAAAARPHPPASSAPTPPPGKIHPVIGPPAPAKPTNAPPPQLAPPQLAPPLPSRPPPRPPSAPPGS